MFRLQPSNALLVGAGADRASCRRLPDPAAPFQRSIKLRAPLRDRWWTRKKPIHIDEQDETCDGMEHSLVGHDSEMNTPWEEKKESNRPLYELLVQWS
mmetsp:Transcript_19547/g.54563  ORF Transcript_19547/g.54563 Transcript_19547/m.54563 type:complete len:98 (-) Transcript_19547:208-501(-)